MEMLGRRTHRPFTSLSGLVLFACLFLPAVKACNSPVMPYELPQLCPPYALGLLIAVIAMARTRRGLGAGLLVLRIVLVAMLVGGMITVPYAPAVGAALMLFAAVFTAIVGLTRRDERSVAILSITANAIWAVWFVLWCTDSGALVGVYVSLFACLGMIVGGVIWVGDVALSSARPEIPTATVLSSRR
jgi:hypothetical protein